MDKILGILEKKHGDKLDLKNHIYYLFVNDAVISVFYDEDEKRIKIDVELTGDEGRFVYFDESVRLDELV